MITTLQPGPIAPVASEPRVAAERLAEAIRFRTVSLENAADIDGDAFLRLHAFLERAFPQVHRALRREVVGGLSLLYTWEGRDASLGAILLSAHMDVVPVAPESEVLWSHPPFAGRIADGHVWGRGTLDDKAAVLGILEAVETLLTEGFRPARTVYLAFGHDEEQGGADGAAEIAALLRSRQVRLEYVVDEGLVVGDGLIPGVRRPVAMIGVAEKGRAALEIIAHGPDGHASMPPAQGVIGVLARAVTRLEANPMPAAIRSPVRELLEGVAPEMSFGRRLVFSHLGLSGPLVTRLLGRSHTMNAAIRTTTAVTTAASGGKINVMPGEARFTVDARILPGDSVAAVVDHVRGVIDDPGVEIRILNATEPSPVAPIAGVGFRALAETVHRIFPDALVTPGLLVAGTDSKHYVPLAGAVYRFRPFRLTRQDVGRIHGVNERIGLDDYARVIAFHRTLLRGLDGPPSGGRHVSPISW